MLTKLTDEQISKFPEYVRMWVEIGHSTQTEPMDKPTVEQIVARVYKEGGLAAPRHHIYVQSPKQGCKVAAQLLKHGSVKGYEKVRVTKTEIEQQIYRCGYGQHDVGWLSFYSYFLYECGLEAGQKLVPLMELAKHCNWYWPFENVIVISEKPTEFHINAQGRLHNPADMAIKYGDDSGVYALNGIRFPDSQWFGVSPKSMKLDEILAIENTEQRTEVLKLYGLDRVQSLAKIVETWKSQRNGVYKLHRLELPNGNTRIYLSGNCPSTGEPFYEAVDPRITTCQQALVWREPGRNFDLTSIPDSGIEYIEPVLST